MDTVILDGVQYIKATEAAKQFDYTSDYVGQLCRGKKVVARLVGRTWFVNPESLQEHKDGARPGKPKTAADDANEPQDAAESVTINRRDVEPVLTGKATRSLQSEPAAPESPTTRSVRYETDAESLYPPLQKSPSGKPPRRLAIEYHNGRRVKVKGPKKQARFAPTDLPDVALSGTLEVTEIEVESSDTALKNKDISSEQKSDDPHKANESKSESTRKEPSTDTKPNKKSEPKLKRVPSDKEAFVVPLHVTETQSDDSSGDETEQSQTDSTADHIAADDASQVFTRAPSNHRARSTDAPNSFTPRTVAAIEQVRVSPWVHWSPLIATVVAVACVLLIFSASSLVLTDGGSSIVFQVATLFEMLQN